MTQPSESVTLNQQVFVIVDDEVSGGNPGGNPAGNQWLPEEQQFSRWAQCALDDVEGTLNIQVLAAETMRLLNRDFAGKDKATNVLSFPAMEFEQSDTGQIDNWPVAAMTSFDELGDIAICADIVNQEARAQQKLPEAHWAHMVVHGVLHILGYDHLEPEQAANMEQKESELLQSLGYEDPWSALPAHSVSDSV